MLPCCSSGLQDHSQPVFSLHFQSLMFVLYLTSWVFSCTQWEEQGKVHLLHLGPELEAHCYFLRFAYSQLSTSRLKIFFIWINLLFQFLLVKEEITALVSPTLGIFILIRNSQGLKIKQHLSEFSSESIILGAPSSQWRRLLVHTKQPRNTVTHSNSVLDLGMQKLKQSLMNCSRCGLHLKKFFFQIYLN